MSIDEHPHGMRCLRRHAMHLESAKEADDRVGNPLARVGQRAQLGHRGLREPVEATIHLFEYAAVPKPLQVSAWDPGVVHVTRAHRPLAGKAKQYLGLGGSLRGHGSICLPMTITTDVLYRVAKSHSRPFRRLRSSINTWGVRAQFPHTPGQVAKTLGLRSRTS